MGNIIFGYILKLKDVFQKWTGSLFSKLKDPVTGKPKYLSGAALKNILVFGFTAFIVTILIVQIMGRVERSGSSVESYKKEFLANNGVSARKIDEKNLFAGDPLSNILSGDRSTRDNYLGVDKQSESEPLSVSSCNSLKERIQAGGKLTEKEKNELNQCLDTGILQVSAEEKKLLKALNSAPTDEARAALLKGDKDPVSKLLMSANDLDKLKKGINELGKVGVKSNEDSLKEAATKAAESNNGSGKNQINSLNKALDGIGLNKDDVKNIKSVLPSSESDPTKLHLSGASSGEDKIQQMRDLAGQIKANKEALDKANQELAQAQALAQEAAKKILRGEAVNEKEAEAAKTVAEAAKNKATEEKRREQLKAQYDAIKKDIEASLLSVNNEVSEDILSWDSSEEYNNGLNKKGPKKKIVKQETIPKIIPQPIENSPIAGLGKRLASNEAGDKIDINKLIIGDAATNAKLILSPDMKIAAILDTEILVASNQNSQFVKVKILMDVYDPQTNKIAIPKGSYLTGSTSSFNEETGVMDLTLSKVSVGKSRFTVPVKIGSADGSIGLKGEVRDTRGRRLLGAFITSFSAGALDWFGSSVVSSYQKSTNSMTALQGAGLSGGSEVMKKISEMYAQDLNNAPTIFYCPRGVPIVLFPEGE